MVIFKRNIQEIYYVAPLTFILKSVFDELPERCLSHALSLVCFFGCKKICHRQSGCDIGVMSRGIDVTYSGTAAVR